MRTSLAIFALVSAVPALVAAQPTYGSSPSSSSTPCSSTPTPTPAPVSSAPAIYTSVPSGPTYGSGSGSDSAPIPDDRNSGAATIYKAQKLRGQYMPTDYTPLPADGSCLDLSSLYGAWEGKTRSLVVQAGYKCNFYTEFACASTTPLCLDATDKKITMEKLDKEFDSKIMSVKCEKVVAS